MDIYITRHTLTNYNVKNLICDGKCLNVKITKLGKKQAKEIAKKLRKVEFDIIFISQMFRTKQTAKIIAKYQKSKPKIKIDKRLNEIITGLSGQPTKIFDNAKDKSKNPWKFKVKGGESCADVEKRINSFLKYLKKLKYKKVLIISHEITIKVLLGYFRNLSKHKALHLPIKHGKIFKFKI